MRRGYTRRRRPELSTTARSGKSDLVRTGAELRRVASAGAPDGRWLRCRSSRSCYATLSVCAGRRLRILFGVPNSCDFAELNLAARRCSSQYWTTIRYSIFEEVQMWQVRYRTPSLPLLITGLNHAEFCVVFCLRRVRARPSVAPAIFSTSSPSKDRPLQS